MRRSKPEYGQSPRPATPAWTTWPETRRPPGAPSTTSSPQCKPAAYDQTVALLSDLRAPHERQVSAADFDRRSGELRTAHRGKPSLMRRFDALGFPNP
ncbi:hypothetical protein ACWELV_18385 [Streptomyces mirabilis]